MRSVSRRGFSMASLSVNAGRRLALATKRPCTWQARMRSSSITGVLVASDSSKPCLHRLHDGRQVGPRIEQPHLRLHGEGVRALLHDAGAFAVVLADDDQRAAGDASGGQVGQRIGGDVGADGGLEGGRAAQRIVDRRGQRRGRRGLRGAVLEVHAQLGEDVVGVGQHVHQMGDRRALVAGDVRHARLQQRLGHGQDALAVEHLALAQAQLGHLCRERTFSHGDFRLVTAAIYAALDASG